jgi:hypothetical protein
MTWIERTAAANSNEDKFFESVYPFTNHPNFASCIIIASRFLKGVKISHYGRPKRPTNLILFNIALVKSSPSLRNFYL